MEDKEMLFKWNEILLIYYLTPEKMTNPESCFRKNMLVQSSCLLEEECGF